MSGISGVCAARGCTKPASAWCSQCRVKRYCSSTCAGNDWKAGHHKECQKLKAAAAQAAAQQARQGSQPVSRTAPAVAARGGVVPRPGQGAARNTAAAGQPNPHAAARGAAQGRGSGEAWKLNRTPWSLIDKLTATTTMITATYAQLQAHLKANPNLMIHTQVKPQQGSAGQQRPGAAKASVQDEMKVATEAWTALVDGLLATATKQWPTGEPIPEAARFAVDASGKSEVGKQIEKPTMALLQQLQLGYGSSDEAKQVEDKLKTAAVGLKNMLQAIPPSSIDKISDVPPSIQKLVTSRQALVAKHSASPASEPADDAAKEKLQKAKDELSAATTALSTGEAARRDAQAKLEVSLAEPAQKEANLKKRLLEVTENLENKKKALKSDMPLVDQLKAKLRLLRKDVEAVSLAQGVQAEDTGLVRKTLDFMLDASELVGHLAAKELKGTFAASTKDAATKCGEAAYYQGAVAELASLPKGLSAKLSNFYTSECRSVASEASKELQFAKLLMDCVVQSEEDPTFMEARSLIQANSEAWTGARYAAMKGLPADDPDASARELLVVLQPIGKTAPIGWAEGKKQLMGFAGSRNQDVELLFDPVAPEAAVQCVHLPALFEALQGLHEGAFDAAACVSAAVDGVLQGTHRRGLCYLVKDGRAMGRSSIEGYDKGSIEEGPGPRAMCANALCVAAAHARMLHPSVERVAIVDLFHNAPMAGTHQLVDGDASTLMIKVSLRDNKTLLQDVENGDTVKHPSPNIVHVDAPVASVGTAWSTVEALLKDVVLPRLRSFTPQLVLVNMGTGNLVALSDEHSAGVRALITGTTTALSAYSMEENAGKLVATVECAGVQGVANDGMLRQLFSDVGGCLLPPDGAVAMDVEL